VIVEIQHHQKIVWIVKAVKVVLLVKQIIKLQKKQQQQNSPKRSGGSNTKTRTSGHSGSRQSPPLGRPPISDPDPISIKTSKTTSHRPHRRRSYSGNQNQTPKLKVETTNNRSIIHSWSMSLGHTYTPETALYGRGIYLAPNPSLYMASNTRGGLFCVCLILRGLVYKCQTIQLGGWLTKPYHSHHSPDGQDIILFDSDQILPCYLIHLKTHTLRPSPLPSPDLSPRSHSRSRSFSGSSGGSTPRSRGSRPGSRSSTPGSRKKRQSNRKKKLQMVL